MEPARVSSPQYSEEEEFFNHYKNDDDEEERLYLQLETRERVQTNEAKSKRRRASPTQTTSQRDNTPASQCLPSRRALLASEGYRQPNTPQGLRGEEERLYFLRGVQGFQVFKAFRCLRLSMQEVLKASWSSRLFWSFKALMRSRL